MEKYICISILKNLKNIFWELKLDIAYIKENMSAIYFPALPSAQRCSPVKISYPQESVIPYLNGFQSVVLGPVYQHQPIH